MWSLIVFIDEFLSLELLFLLQVSWVNHISFYSSLSQHPIKHNFAHQGTNTTNKRGALQGRILWIHLPSISSQEEKHIMSLSRCQVSPNRSLPAKHQNTSMTTWPGFYTLERNLKELLRHWLWGSTSGTTARQERMLRVLKRFPCSPFTNHGPHPQGYLSPSQAEGEGKTYTWFVIGQGDVAFPLPDLWEWRSGRAGIATAWNWEAACRKHKGTAQGHG